MVCPHCNKAISSHTAICPFCCAAQHPGRKPAHNKKRPSLAGPLLCSLVILGLLIATVSIDFSSHRHPTLTESVPTETTGSASTQPSTALSTTVTTTTTATTTTPSSMPSAQINAPLLHQFPDYPSGCELVSATMALSYAGESITADTVLSHLPRSSRFYWKDNTRYGPSPYEYFLGDPRSENSYGCMAPVIKETLIRCLGTADRVTDATGQDLSTLCNTYIATGTPVIVWASIAMIPLEEEQQWTLPDGSLYTWPSNEHCLLLVGYTASQYIFNDPYTGTRVGYPRAVCEQRYAQMGKQALVVHKAP